ncbi:ABC transporter ATP-binding protein [Desulfothermobacter acidiphilus]|uniref:ABC transporter ATP-binding protein n=1 Tax=Desulfothermobacter acidiphilus TaxID=1938353 RepID=UPI003F8C6D00
MKLLEVKGLVKHYVRKRGLARRETIRAVDGVSFSLAPGETLGLVGESGCGKSTLGRLILRLEEPTAGEVIFEGVNIATCGEKELRERRRHLQIVFQDAYSSLNPRRTVGASVEEHLANFGMPRSERRERVRELLQLVGLNPEEAAKYPHELSGGQRQRVNLARALALQPKLIVCDEPVSSLDVSIRAQILKLLRELKERFRLSYLFISHDLAAVSCLADRVAVMYLGKIMEILSAEALSQARHPYTRALWRSVLPPDPRNRATLEPAVKGEPPDPANPPPGCRFHPRCPQAQEFCRREEPVLREIKGGHLVACHMVV